MFCHFQILLVEIVNVFEPDAVCAWTLTLVSVLKVLTLEALVNIAIQHFRFQYADRKSLYTLNAAFLFLNLRETTVVFLSLLNWSAAKVE